MSLVLHNRGDQNGSNFIIKIAEYMYAKKHNLKIYYTDDMPYQNSIFNLPFLKHGICTKNETPHNIFKDNQGGIRGRQIRSLINFKQDLFSYFHEHHQKELYNIVKEEAIKKNFTLPWNDNKNIICIHLRISDGQRNEYDGSNIKDYDGSGASNYYNMLFEKNTDNINPNMDQCINWCKTNGYNWGNARHPDAQCCIDINKLETLIIDFRKKYPDKKIYFVTKLPRKQKINNYTKLASKYNIEILSNNNPDIDLWCLIHSDILVLSKSTFSMMACYYFQGSQLHYPIWGTNTCAGLNTKYNKTNWCSYI